MVYKNDFHNEMTLRYRVNEEKRHSKSDVIFKVSKGQRQHLNTLGTEDLLASFLTFDSHTGKSSQASVELNIIQVEFST